MRPFGKILSSLFALCLLLSAFPAPLFADDGPAAKGPDASCVPGELIVVFDESVSERAAENLIDDSEGALLDLLALPNEEAVVALVELPADLTVDEAAEAFSDNPLVDFAQPNYLYTLADAAAPVAPFADESAADLQWHLADIGVPAAWDWIDGYSGRDPVYVTVLDNSAYPGHADLTANIATDLARDFSRAPAVLPYPTTGYEAHGTHVVGIIGATANNGMGPDGVAAGKKNNIVKVIPLNVFQSNGATTQALIGAIDYAVRETKTKVINMSLGYVGERDLALERAVNGAVSSGVTVVCAAGNSDGSAEMPYTVWPGDFDAVIGVVNLNRTGRRDGSSNYGEAKDISAPGTDIYGTVSSAAGSNAYARLTGTSMAAPVVAGVAAMMLYVNPNLSPADVMSILRTTATPLADPTAAGGKVNAAAAVQAAATAEGNSMLTGTVAIEIPNGGPYYGQTLTANVTSLNAGMDALSYQWERDGLAIADATTRTYTVTGADIGHKLSITIKASSHMGGLTSAPTAAVTKAPAPELVWPSAASIPYGQPLSAAALSGGSTEYGGFAWAEPAHVPDAGIDAYDVIFTPSAD
ncbi:MAG: S8 family serine peptidase, partial [Clostridiales Family XIII bacterium]|nr:S8 family serine peptidase [Clostridiales Family XIII bacterium]